MSWEMAMARALISSRPQIPWDPARGQETGAHWDAKRLLYFVVGEEGGDFDCYPWMCVLALPGSKSWVGTWE